MLKQNNRITKSDEISIIAYNSGLKNFFKTKEKLKKDKISYVEYLENADSKSFGFASRNFLMEYFALQESIKPTNLIKDVKQNDLKFYISRCKTKPHKVLSLMKNREPSSFRKNNHFKNLNKILSPGQIYITTLSLPDKFYRKVKNSEIKRQRPIDWLKNTDFKNCKII